MSPAAVAEQRRKFAAELAQARVDFVEGVAVDVVDLGAATVVGWLEAPEGSNAYPEVLVSLVDGHGPTSNGPGSVLRVAHWVVSLRVV